MRGRRESRGRRNAGPERRHDQRGFCKHGECARGCCLRRRRAGDERRKHFRHLSVRQRLLWHRCRGRQRGHYGRFGFGPYDGARRCIRHHGSKRGLFRQWPYNGGDCTARQRKRGRFERIRQFSAGNRSVYGQRISGEPRRKYGQPDPDTGRKRGLRVLSLL